MKKILLFVISAFAMLSCNHTKTANSIDSDKQATRESAFEILKHMPGWSIADSSWWSHRERYRNVSLERIHLHLIAVKGKDTLYVETGEMYGNEYMSGLVRYPSTFNTPINEKKHKNNIMRQIFEMDSCFRLEAYPDSSMAAVFECKR
jgi:hypothetical protein